MLVCVLNRKVTPSFLERINKGATTIHQFTHRNKRFIFRTARRQIVKRGVSVLRHHIGVCTQMQKSHRRSVRFHHDCHMQRSLVLVVYRIHIDVMEDQELKYRFLQKSSAAVVRCLRRQPSGVAYLLDYCVANSQCHCSPNTLQLATDSPLQPSGAQYC